MMEQTATELIQSTDHLPQVCITALSDRFALRGLSRSAQIEAEEQIAGEEKTREIAPLAYRMSLLSDAAVCGLYRRGKAHMSSEDLLRYVQEGRQMQLAQKDFSDFPSLYETACASATPMTEVAATDKTNDRKRQGLLSFSAKGIRLLQSKLPQWFNSKPSDTSQEKRKFPLSAFAAITAIAVSMMLIVASALMVTYAETQISQLNADISGLSGEVKELRSDLESGADLMEIRRIAVEEYGMVEQDYVKTEYISLDSTEEIEIYEAKRNRGIGLSAILSAIGLKK